MRELTRLHVKLPLYLAVKVGQGWAIWNRGRLLSRFLAMNEATAFISLALAHSRLDPLCSGDLTRIGLSVFRPRLALPFFSGLLSIFLGLLFLNPSLLNPTS